MVLRRETNLQHFETTPYAHRYLLRRPRTYDHQRPVGRAINLDGPEEAESAKIDNPWVEKRMRFPFEESFFLLEPLLT